METDIVLPIASATVMVRDERSYGNTIRGRSKGPIFLVAADRNLKEVIDRNRGFMNGLGMKNKRNI